nr:thiolase family protein [uncultured Roseibium sp.]
MTARDGSPAYIIGARRTPVAPLGGALAHLQADELAAPVLKRLLEDAGLAPASVDHVILGNALYAGGNPARLAALRAGLPAEVPAMTIDTQCCSGLDAITLGVRMIEAGAADCVLAGGAESFSRSPIRMHRPTARDTEPVAYNRPAFAPPPFADPDLTEAAARLAQDRKIPATVQAEFAVASHAKAVKERKRWKRKLVTCSPDAREDDFTRPLALKTALRAPVLAGSHGCELTAATIACEADGAAAVLLVSERIWKRSGRPGLKSVAARSAGGDPSDPALAPIGVARSLFAELGKTAAEFEIVELMEAYAVQAMVSIEDLGFDADAVNRHGGALARGHPIGASGAILMVQLFDQLARTSGNAEETRRRRGLALIAAAGGLGSGMAVEAVIPEQEYETSR